MIFFSLSLSVWHAVHIELQCPHNIFEFGYQALLYFLFFFFSWYDFYAFLDSLSLSLVLWSGCNITLLSFFGTLKMELNARAELGWTVYRGDFVCLLLLLMII